MVYDCTFVDAKDALAGTAVGYLEDIPFRRFVRYFEDGKPVGQISIEGKAQALHWHDPDKFCKTLYRRGKLYGSSEASPIYGFLVSDSRAVSSEVEGSITVDGKSIRRWRPVEKSELPIGMTPGTCGPFLAQKDGFPDLERITLIVDIEHQHRMMEFAIPGKPDYGMLAPFMSVYKFLEKLYGEKISAVALTASADSRILPASY